MAEKPLLKRSSIMEEVGFRLLANSYATSANDVTGAYTLPLLPKVSVKSIALK